MTCGSNLVTRNTGARSQSDCLAPAGYARSSPTTATACARSEYAPQFNRLSKCLRCQSGLEEPQTSGLTDGQRSSKRAVCSECLADLVRHAAARCNQLAWHMFIYRSML